MISIAQGAGITPRRIEIDNYAQLTGLNHLVASPTGAPVNGGNADDLWIAADGVNSTFSDVSQHFDTLSNDVLIGGTGNDTINAGVGADLIFGGAGNDTIDAGTGNDVVTGGAGNDTIEGGAGDDVFVFNRGDGTDTIHDIGVVIERDELNPEFGRDYGDGIVQPLFRPYSSPIAIGTVINGGSDTLQFGRGITVEDLIVRFVGNNLVVAIKDPAHPDWGFDQLTDKIQLTNWLDTKQRVETSQFADGSVLHAADIAFLAEVPASVVTLLDVTWDAAGLTSTTNARIVVGTGGNDTIAASDGVDIVFANGGNDSVSGGAGNDWLDGGDGNDLIDGGAGADTMVGGIGNDTYIVDNAGDVVVEYAGEGTDTVQTSLASYTLGTALENLIGLAATGQTLTGNALGNSITGGAGNDVLTGGGGNDAINGGAGTDTAVFSGNRADYAVSYNAATRTLTAVDQRAGAPNGTDTLIAVESLQFADQTVAATVFDLAPTDSSLSGNTVAENAANGTAIGTVTGVDPDAGSTLTYSLTNSAGGRFAINPTTGQLTVANGLLLDFESATSHAITVRVTDEAGLTFDKAFTINLTNVNDAPSNATLSGGSVAENSANGTVVGTVTGFDQDAGATLSYSLTNNAGGRFAINAPTGQLTVANGSLLDFEGVASHSHDITVRVADQGGLTFDKTFTINLTNVNEAPTNATLTGGAIAENSANGAVVGIVTGVDPDAGTTFSYSLTDNAGGRFTINPGTGQLTVANSSLLDYEAATSHAITVRVTDQGGLTFDKAFTVAVTNVAGVTLIGDDFRDDTLTGTGEDDTLSGLGENDTLDGLGGSDVLIGGAGNDTIYTDPSDVVVFSGNHADYAFSTAIVDAWTASFTVTVADLRPGAPDGVDTIHASSRVQWQFADGLNATIVLFGPPDLTLSANSVAENPANGTVIGAVASTVPAGGSTLTYSLIDNAGGRFAINATTGQLTIANGSLLDFESAASHGITVRVTHQSGMSVDKAFTINVTNVNEVPSGATLTGGSVAENAANGTVVGTVSGVDPDAGATLSYSLTNNAGGRFAINGTTGQITVANGSLLDYESATSHAITVRVTDQGGLTFDKVFTINLTNVNEAPTNVTLSGSTVAENAPNGTVVGTAAGVDPDAGATLTYSLTNDAGGRFAINAGTGQVTVASASLLDYESATSHAIMVRVTDQGGLTFDKMFTINLTNMNEAPTNATLSGGSVVQHAINGTAVGTVVGIDPDAGATLSYSLIDNVGGRFAVNATTGQLTVANGSLLDYATATSHVVTVRVTDQGGLTFDKAFTINVTTGNQAPTNATLSASTIAENSANGTVVGTVTGVDPDAGATLSYSLTNNAGGRFAVNATTGALTVANGLLLDYESATSHAITVRVTDQGGLTFDKAFTINLTNVNEAPTNATLSSSSVAENSGNGTVVGTVTGVDPDAGATFSYSLTNNAGGRFAVNATTGQLTVANGSLLNYESATSHAITVRVTDQGGLIFDKALTINVTNVNEAPVVTVLNPNVQGSSTSPIPVSTLFTASDPDGNALTYWFYDTTLGGGHFEVNGVWQWDGRDFSVSQADLANTVYVPEFGSTDALQIRVSDGSLYSAWVNLTVYGASPVVLDLDGNGVDIVQLPASTARFDMNGDGRRDATAWAGPADGLLAIDLGEGGQSGPDGVIDQTKEIVFTAWAPGMTSDMAALRRVFETNHNGKLDADDARWSEFRIWQDRNQDGISQDSELTSLDRAGIRSIDLTPAGEAIRFADGSAITGASAYTRTDGATGIAGDVVFAYDAAERGGGAIDASLGRLIQAMATCSGDRSAETWSAPAAADDATLPGCVAAAWHS